MFRYPNYEICEYFNSVASDNKYGIFIVIALPHTDKKNSILQDAHFHRQLTNCLHSDKIFARHFSIEKCEHTPFTQRHMLVVKRVPVCFQLI